jgi:hypothetical protein
MTHQAVMNEIIACHGGNHYKLPHLSKNTLLDNRGVLPRTLSVSKDAEDSFEDLGMIDVGNFIV